MRPLLALLSLAVVAAAAALPATVIEDFESGAVDLVGYPGQDLEPDAWALVGENTYQGSAWSLRIAGNSWKVQSIEPVALTDTTVLQVAVLCERLGEMHAVGFGSGENELFYTFFGEDLPESENWWTVYQGAFAQGEWRAYLLPVGEDWATTFGTTPTLDRLIYVNDDDGGPGPGGVTLFDAIADVTEDQPRPPRCQIVYAVEDQRKVAAKLFQVTVQFQSVVEDPDSPTHTFWWDFGDSTGSDQPDPAHTFLVHADHPYTVGLEVVDEGGLAAGDTCRIAVQPGDGDLPLLVNFVGDIMIGRGYESDGGIIDTYGVEAIFAPTLPIFGEAADVNVANLEVSFTDRGTPHPTKSVVFRARPENITGIPYAGIDVVTLGNNHIVDYGEIGMLDTIDGLETLGIRHSGAGTSEIFALQPCFWTERGVRLAFLGQCNRTGRQWNYQPFLDAGYDKPGFAYFLPDNLAKAITTARELADVVIVQTHSGDEYQTQPPARGPAPPPVPLEAIVPGPGAPEVVFLNEPTPGDRALRRLAVDEGADVLINHHPHVLQGFEAWQGKLIAHSLGNFVFDLYYPETMPTMVLTLEVDDTGIVGQRFTPAWINHWIPRPVTGQLWREITDRLADYSRPMNALVVPHPDRGWARIHLARDEVDSTVVAHEATAALVEQDGRAVSPPLRLAGEGYLSGVTAVTGDGTGWEVRWGREILWHGNFEAEGADLWDVNTQDEWLDDTVAHTGQRSLAVRRDYLDGDQTGTDLEKHLPARADRAHSLCGWLRCDNAGQAVVMARFYSSRYTQDPLTSQDLAPPYDGTCDWTFRWRDLETPSQTAYLDVRCQAEAPATGTGYAWFDDLALIEWEDWVSLDEAVVVPAPHALRFLQVRANGPAATVATVAYLETVYGDPVTTVPGDGPPAAAPPRLAAWPNPFNPRTTVMLDVPGGASVPVVVEIHDLAGRRVATVFRGELAGGRRHGFTWDGRDGAGRAVASGTYLARACVGDRTVTGKLTLIR